MKIILFLYLIITLPFFAFKLGIILKEKIKNEWHKYHFLLIIMARIKKIRLTIQFLFDSFMRKLMKKEFKKDVGENIDEKLIKHLSIRYGMMLKKSAEVINFIHEYKWLKSKSENNSRENREKALAANAKDLANLVRVCSKEFNSKQKNIWKEFIYQQQKELPKRKTEKTENEENTTENPVENTATENTIENLTENTVTENTSTENTTEKAENEIIARKRKIKKAQNISFEKGKKKKRNNCFIQQTLF